MSMRTDYVLDVAVEAASRLGLRVSNPQKILEKMNEEIPAATILYDNEHMLWVDRHYIAYSERDGMEVSYIYLSRRHIREELPELTQLLDGCAAFEDYVFYTSLAEQMQAAREIMKITGRDYYLSPNYEDCLEGMDGEPVKRGGIYLANLDPVTGSGNEHSPTVVILPITGKLRKKPLPTHVRLPASYGLEKDSLALAEQVRAIDRSRLESYIGRAGESAMLEVGRALSVSAGLCANRNEPLVLSLCGRCEADFRDSGYILVKKGWQEEMEPCDFCHVRNGFNFGVFRKEGI